VIWRFFIFGNSRFKGSFAQAASLVFSAASTRTRIVATRLGAYPDTFGLRQGDLPFKGLLAP
jgi:hypothetical protein